MGRQAVVEKGSVEEPMALVEGPAVLGAGVSLGGVEAVSGGVPLVSVVEGGEGQRFAGVERALGKARERRLSGDARGARVALATARGRAKAVLDAGLRSKALGLVLEEERAGAEEVAGG